MDKTTLTQYPKSVTSLVGAKTITGATAYVHGSTAVIELAFSDATTNYLKVGPGHVLELGGTNEMGTGTKVSW